MAGIREAEPAEVERVLGMYEWLFAPPGSVPPSWAPERARQAIAGAIADPGVGKALLDAVRDWARGRGATHLELDSADSRVAAHRFYEGEEPSWTSRCFAWEL